MRNRNHILVILNLVFCYLSVGISFGQSVDCSHGGNTDGDFGKPGGNGPASASGITDSTELVTPNDPNLIIGPQGYGVQRFVARKDPAQYQILFENDPMAASVPAHIVKVFYPIHTNQDIATFRLSSYGFNGLTFTVPPNSTTYSTRLSVNFGIPLFVDVISGIDVVQHQAFWIFETIDPLTGLFPADPLAGFLPVADSTGADTTERGKGFVSFSIQPRANTQTGDSILAIANIFFDVNDPVPTNTEQHIVDALPPVSMMDSVSVSQDSIRLQLSIHDDPNGSGFESYDLYVAKDSTAYYTYATNLTDTFVTYKGVRGSVFHFFALAKDHVGNREALKQNPDVSIHIPISESTWFRDADADGFGDPANDSVADILPTGYVADNSDCDDHDAIEHPGQIWYQDADSDGYSSGAVVTQCLRLPGYIIISELLSSAVDCNDLSPAIHPGATETCNGIDDNCDGQIDDGTLLTFYRDADGDGFGNPGLTTQACFIPIGYVANSADCNDTLAIEHPGQTWYADLDGDGYSSGVSTIQCLRPNGYKAASELTAIAGDCNDNISLIHPGAAETCNGIDDNCNGQIDEGVLTTFYRDADGDGFGNFALTTIACSAPLGYVSNHADCNDTNAAIHPGATELCNGMDDNCDGQIDEGGLTSTFYRDADGDGYGNLALTIQACIAPVGYVANHSDCNDTNPNIHPGATELCNGADDNCNGLIDEGLLPTSPGLIVGPSQGVCKNTTKTYRVAPQSGATFNWTAPVNATIQTGQGTNSVTVRFGNGFISGMLSVRAVKSCGTSVASVLSIFSTPAIPGSISGPTTACKGSIQTYTCTSVLGATSYSWKVTAGSKIDSGQNTQTVGVKFGNNNVTIQVAAVNACGMSPYRSFPVTVAHCAKIIDDPVVSTDLTVYPNPTKGLLTVSFLGEESKKYLLQLFDVLGRVVYNTSVSSSEGTNVVELDLSGITQGIYVLSLKKGDATEIVELMVE